MKKIRFLQKKKVHNLVNSLSSAVPYCIIIKMDWFYTLKIQKR